MGNSAETNRKSGPEQPSALEALTVNERYDNFFRDRLRRAMHDERRRYPEGVATLCWDIERRVRARADGLVNLANLTERNVRNFLAGTDSRTDLIAILDVYIQIIRPEIRKTFFIDGYIDRLGQTLGDYYSETDPRESIEREMAGVYRIVPEESSPVMPIRSLLSG